MPFTQLFLSLQSHPYMEMVDFFKVRINESLLLYHIEVYSRAGIQSDILMCLNMPTGHANLHIEVTAQVVDMTAIIHRALTLF